MGRFAILHRATFFDMKAITAAAHWKWELLMDSIWHMRQENAPLSLHDWEVGHLPHGVVYNTFELWSR